MQLWRPAAGLARKRQFGLEASVGRPCPPGQVSLSSCSGPQPMGDPRPCTMEDHHSPPSPRWRRPSCPDTAAETSGITFDQTGGRRGRPSGRAGLTLVVRAAAGQWPGQKATHTGRDKPLRDKRQLFGTRSVRQRPTQRSHEGDEGPGIYETGTGTPRGGGTVTLTPAQRSSASRHGAGPSPPSRTPVGARHCSGPGPRPRGLQSPGTAALTACGSGSICTVFQASSWSLEPP